MKTPAVGSQCTRSPSITVSDLPARMASHTALNCTTTVTNADHARATSRRTCTEQTDSTSGTSLLNSSKHPQDPARARSK